MHVTIWAVGKLRDPPVAALCDEYLKRLGRHLKVALEELRSDEEVLRRVPRGAHLVALDAGGTQRSSEALATWLQQRLTDPAPLQLVIGGAEGLGATPGLIPLVGIETELQHRTRSRTRLGIQPVEGRDVGRASGVAVVVVGDDGQILPGLDRMLDEVSLCPGLDPDGRPAHLLGATARQDRRHQGDGCRDTNNYRGSHVFSPCRSVTGRGSPAAAAFSRMAIISALCTVAYSRRRRAAAPG